VLTIGCAPRSPHSTTSRLLTIDALRSSSSVHDAFCDSIVERHFHHADGAFDDALAGGDDGAGLLALQHRGGDLRRVGEVADARLEHLDAGLRQSLVDLALQVVGDRDVCPRSETSSSSCASYG
jgi:hypothetical protein